jgi:phosphoglycerate dehydrogenase-like enzyme
MNLKECRLLVTPTSFGKSQPALRTELEAQVGEVIYNDSGKPLNAEQMARLLVGMDGVIAGLDQLDAVALAGADRLKVIARYGVGLDNVDLAEARRRGIVVTYTPGANAVSVAELTIGLLLALARRLPEAFVATRQGEWPRLAGVSLKGKTVGLLGLGAIGREVVRRLSGFECRLLAVEPYPDRDFAAQWGVALVSLPELLNQADFISLHLPLLSETRGLVNDDFLNQVKAGAYLVNTARGELIDEAALFCALQSGRLGGAALDVFIEEPPGRENPLLALPQVIVTPHCGAHADDATNAMGRLSMADCLAVLRGEEPQFRVV